MKKEEALQRITTLLEKVHTIAQENEKRVIPFRIVDYVALINKCLDLEEKILEESDHVNTVKIDDKSVRVRASIIKLELDFATLQGDSRRIFAFIGVIALIIASLALWFLGSHFQRSLESIFGQTIIYKYIALGIGGALIFFITEGLLTENTLQPSIIAQITLSIIIPIVLVVCFVNKEGKMEPNLPALLSFAVGYSSKIAIMLLNKIVEKGEQVIKAI